MNSSPQLATKSSPMPEAALLIPRRLAIQLLHEAQIATEPFVGFVLADEGEGSAPDSWLPLRDDDVLQAARERLVEHGKRVWAVYRHRPVQPAPPVLDDYAQEPALLRLTASLAIKGVLQLRGWWLIDGRVVEQELDVRD